MALHFEWQEGGFAVQGWLSRPDLTPLRGRWGLEFLLRENQISILTHRILIARPLSAWVGRGVPILDPSVRRAGSQPLAVVGVGLREGVVQQVPSLRVLHRGVVV